jgi:hypothetical protein
VVTQAILELAVIQVSVGVPATVDLAESQVILATQDILDQEFLGIAVFLVNQVIPVSVGHQDIAAILDLVDLQVIRVIVGSADILASAA